MKLNTENTSRSQYTEDKSTRVILMGRPTISYDNGSLKKIKVKRKCDQQKLEERKKKRMTSSSQEQGEHVRDADDPSSLPRL